MKLNYIVSEQVFMCFFYFLLTLLAITCLQLHSPQQRGGAEAFFFLMHFNGQYFLSLNLYKN